MANIIKGLGGNSPGIKLPKGYELKTGSISFGTANANPNIIPIMINVYLVHNGRNGVKYGSKVLAQMGQYISNNNLLQGWCSTLPLYDYDYTKVVKENLTTLYSVNYENRCTVTQWLEKVGGGS